MWSGQTWILAIATWMMIVIVGALYLFIDVRRHRR